MGLCGITKETSLRDRHTASFTKKLCFATATASFTKKLCFATATASFDEAGRYLKQNKSQSLVFLSKFLSMGVRS